MKKITIEYGDIIFLQPENIFQKIIAYFDGRYSHCGIALSSSQYLSMTRRGVIIEKIPKNRKISVFELDVSHQEKKELIKFLLSHMTTASYDFSGILSYMFSFILQNPKRFYCSEFISWGLYYIGLLPDSLQLTPLQLSNQEFLKKK